MTNKMKYAFTTTLCDEYIDGFFITFLSILKTTVNFNYDLVIFEWGSLSEKNKIKIKKLYNNVIFKNIKKELYQNCLFSTEIRDWRQFNPAYRFEIFDLIEYTKIVYFDCDIIFEVDMSNVLLDSNIKFGACKMNDIKKYHQTLNNQIFNGGLLVIDNYFLNEKVKNDLIDISKLNPPQNTLDSNIKWIGNQPILNNYFFDNVNWLDEKYNVLADTLTLNHFNYQNNYHIIGSKKPWMKGDINKKFDKYVINRISFRPNSNPVLCSLILKKILKKYEIIKNELDMLGI